MDCRGVAELLSAYLDGQLAGEVRRQVAAHLKTCSACQEELAWLARLDAALGALESPVPPGLAERVLARLPHKRRRSRWQSVALAASLVLGIILGGNLARDFYPYAPGGGNGADEMALEAFQDFPRGSWGDLLVTYQPEEANGA
jgi:anti-sigma factor RsiW